MADAYRAATGFVAAPINTRTGGYDYTVSDISIPTSAGSLTFQREYTSLSVDNPTLLSAGWTHNHDTRLIFPSDPEGQPDTVLFKAHTANKYLFTINGDGTYFAFPGLCATLEEMQGGYILKDGGQKTYTFDSSGKLLSHADAEGHAWNYAYLANGKLEYIYSNGGADYLKLEYDGQGRIARVRDHTNRFVEYHYDANGNLTSADDVTNETWTYQYHPTLEHFLTRVAAPGNVTVERTEFYPDGKAWKQFDGEDNLTAELTYNTDGTTTITDALGNSMTHTYDGRGTLVSNENAAGGEVGKAYDYNFRPKTITDGNENITNLTWSSDGNNLTKIIDAALGETDIAYGPLNNPTSIIDPMNYETKYFYEDANFPAQPTKVEYPLSYNGGASFVSTTYQYYAPNNVEGQPAGKLKLMTDALGNQTFYTYTSSGQFESVTSAYGTPEAQTSSNLYDNRGNLVEQMDPSGLKTRYEYDNANRLTKVIQNYLNGGVPQNDQDKYNIVTEYRYDVRGNQIAVIDTIGVITRTWYDLTNRPMTVVQNLTGQTIGSASPPARGSGITDENIRTDTIYDDAGNVIATTDPAGIITRTYYDEANRPKLIIQNWAGADLYGNISTAPAYNPAIPDQNVRTEYFYDLNNNLIASKDTLGIYTRTYYDALNRPVTVVQHLTGQDISVANPPGRGSSSNIRTDTYYDANGNVIAMADPKGVITRTYYDSMNRPITVVQNLTGQTIGASTPPPAGATDANIRADTYYDQAGNVIATVDPRGMVTRTYYDSANRPVTTVQNFVGDIYATAPPPRGSEESTVNARTDIAYDQNGRRDTVTDPLGHVTKYEYNEIGQLVKVTANHVNGGIPQNDQDQRNIVTEYAYDVLGRQVMATDTLGRVSLNSHDDLGRLLSRTQNYLAGQPRNYKAASGDQYNLITSFAYDIRGNQIAVTDTKSAVTRTYYDVLGRPVAVARNLLGHDLSLPFPPVRANPPSTTGNLLIETVYLGNGSVDYVTDEMGQTTDYTYDPLGRLITVLDPLLHSTSFGYDANGNRASMTDAEGVVSRYEYDSLNRLTAVIENYRPGFTPDHETNVRTEYTYDAAGNRLSILDGSLHPITFTYSAFGQLETEVDALGNVTTHAYNVIGNRISLLDANGDTTVFGYNEMNRLEVIDYPGTGMDVSFEYDALGRRVSMTDGVGNTSWEYNNLNLPKSISDPFTASVSYDYDPLGNRTALTYPDSTVVNYQYNGLNRLEAVSSSSIGITQYEYDAAGRLKAVERPNGVETLYNYHNNGWLQDIVHSSGADVLASYQYQYDNVGNRVQAAEQWVTNAGAGPTVHLTVADNTGALMTGREVYVFDGDTYSGYHATTDENGQVAITLPQGSYRFRVDVDGTQFWSGAENHCTIGECDNLLVTVTAPTLVHVSDSNGVPQADVPVYAFIGTQYANHHGTTDEDGNLSLRLRQGEYTIRADFGGGQFWSAEVCNVPSCWEISITVNQPLTVTVLDNIGMPHAGVEVYAFDGNTYTGKNATTDENGQVKLTLLDGEYRFRADFNGTQFWSGAENHCTVPACGEAGIAVTLPLVVTVMDGGGAPQQGISVYAFNESTYTGFNGITDVDGRVNFTLPAGSYRFRADLNGTQFWSGTSNHCDVPDCTGAQVTVTNTTTVTVTDTDGAPRAGLKVYAFNGTTYTGHNATTDAGGQVVFTLPAGSYRFRADLNGTQFWSGTSNHCDVPGCSQAGVTVTNGVSVTVTDTDGAPKAGLKVYAFNGATYTGYNATTNASGQVTFTLPAGSYRFRADLNGTQFWSGTANHCGVPGCANASVIVSIPLTLTVQTADETLQSGIKVYAFNGTTYTGYNATTDTSGQATLTLPLGSYRFRADYNGTQYWSDASNHCTIPGCTTLTVIVGPQPTATATFTAMATSTATAIDTPTHTPLPPTSTPEPTETASPTPEPTATETPSGSGYQPSLIMVSAPKSMARNSRLLVARPGPQSAPPNDIIVTVLDTDDDPKGGLRVYVFDETTYTGFNGTTGENGQVLFSLPDGNYRFRADYNGTQFWSNTQNHCAVPGCDPVAITVTKPVTITVQDMDDSPKAGVNVYAFDGSTYTGYHSATDANGQASLTLPLGSYRFRADYNGTQFWSDPSTGSTGSPQAGSGENHCDVTTCEAAIVTVANPLAVTVLDTDATPAGNLKVYAFDGGTYSGYHAVTDANGQAVFTLPFGEYHFRADFNGTQFWSGEENHCDTSAGCGEAGITVTKPVLVTVANAGNTPYAGLPVYAFSGATYSGYHGLTDANGFVTFTLPAGEYRFRADLHGVPYWSNSSAGTDCSIPGCESVMVIIPGGFAAAEVTIDYVYDPLYRLTAADYSNGDFYHYAYDPVGNRLTQDNMLNGQSSVVNYTYDNANRLASAGGVTYTFDNNGNLLSDGVNTYTYDSANRLISVLGSSTSSQYVYNGLGDRLSQNGVNHTLDLNSGLTQVLSDGTTTYTYGLGRISQQAGETPEYFLGDALGSVRQMTDQAGTITFAREYDPYGVVTNTTGASQTEFGFTGEQYGDSTQLLYLRARYYSPADGRFTSRDTWSGDVNRPLSLNRWMYVGGNPINLTDPSGHFPPFWCQAMPNKGLYEACVDLHYGIEPMNPLKMGEHVTGSQGCYSGPTEYRAGGYIEGTSVTLAFPMFSNWLFAFESVYDFATMQQSMFINENSGITGFPGIGLSDFVFGIVGAEYAGHAYGFLTNTGILQDYPGPIIAGYFGGSIGLPFANDTLGVGVGVGTTLFASPYPPYIRGNSVYVSFWAGADFIPYVDAGIGVLSMKAVNNRVDSYVVGGDVQTSRLYLDILFGRHNGWLTHTIPFLPLGMNLNLDWAARVIAANKALRYAEAYEELR